MRIACGRVSRQIIGVWFKSNFQDTELYIEDIEQTGGAAGYGSANNVKHGEMEDAFTNLAHAIALRDTVFTELMTTNGNFSTQLRQQEDKIRVFQAKIYNLKFASVMKTVDRKIKKTGRPYARDKRQKSQWSTYPTEKKYNNKNYCWSHGYDPSDPHTSKTCTSTQYGHI